MKKQTLRQAIIEAAARSFKDASGVTTPMLSAWVDKSGAAAGVAHDFGLNRAGLSDAVDGMDFLRLTAAVDKQVARESKHNEWVAALRGRP
jgi:hypothetical protein